MLLGELTSNLLSLFPESLELILNPDSDPDLSTLLGLTFSNLLSLFPESLEPIVKPDLLLSLLGLVDTHDLLLDSVLAVSIEAFGS